MTPVVAITLASAMAGAAAPTVTQRLSRKDTGAVWHRGWLGSICPYVHGSQAVKVAYDGSAR